MFVYVFWIMDAWFNIIFLILIFDIFFENPNWTFPHFQSSYFLIVAFSCLCFYFSVSPFPSFCQLRFGFWIPAAGNFMQYITRLLSIPLRFFIDLYSWVTIWPLALFFTLYNYVAHSSLWQLLQMAITSSDCLFEYRGCKTLESL